MVTRMVLKNNGCPPLIGMGAGGIHRLPYSKLRAFRFASLVFKALIPLDASVL